MIFLNPQWQGAGYKDELSEAVFAFKKFLPGKEFIDLPLSTREVREENNIIGYQALLEQTTLFRSIISEKQPANVFTIAGDCGAEIIPISYVNHLHPNLAVLWMDAHADLNTPESSPSKAFHGMPLRTLLGDGDKAFKDLLFSFLQPSQISFIGLRDCDKPEEEFIQAHSIPIFKDADIESIITHLDKNKVTEIYTHLDLDVLDPTEFPHLLYPVNNGLTIAKITALIKELKRRYNMTGFCITESATSNTTHLSPLNSILQLMN